MTNHNNRKNNKDFKQLIILGNGFDLACGLKSSYFDFFQFRFTKIAGQSKIEEYYQKEILNQPFDRIKYTLNKITFWDIIFISEYCNKNISRNYEWNNIESTIYKVLHYFATEDALTNLSDTGKHLLQNIKLKYNYSDFAFKELAKFENYFNDYIVEEMNNNHDYLSTFVPEKLSDLIKDNIIVSHSKNLSILSFNYTINKETIKKLKVNPAGTYMLSNYNELSTPLNDITNSWVNIHGKVDNDSSHANPLIFGIDSNIVNRLDNDSPEYKLEVKFTKTFRVAINNFSRDIFSLPQSIDLITFYGHSLSSADFSYFESIFDMYNLYNSNLKLEFYFGTYNSLYEIEEHKNYLLGKYINAKNDQNKQKLMSNIYGLFEKYGSTLDNSHGSNLLHRLLLEGRISFKEDVGSFKLTETQANNIIKHLL